MYDMPIDDRVRSHRIGDSVSSTTSKPMTTPVPVTPLAIEDFEAIESAVMETQRGRWFLTEYARRNRNCDTDTVLTTLERIERTMRRDRAAPDIDRIRLDLADMAEAISRTKQEIAQMKVESDEGGRFAEASQELGAIVDQTETATNEILLAAEGIQEVAWTLREAGASEDLCEKLDAHATEVYTACSFQDLTGQRTRKVVTVLRYLESRINTMIDIWGMQEDEGHEPARAATRPSASDAADFDPMEARPDAHLLNGPPLLGHGIDQDDVDELMWQDGATPSVEITDTGSVERPADVFAADDPEPTPAPIPDLDVEQSFETGSAGADVFARATPPEPSPTRTVAPERPVPPTQPRAADVFAPSTPAFERPAVAVFETASLAPDLGAPTTMVVGNTVMVLEAEPVVLKQAEPVVLKQAEPSAVVEVERRFAIEIAPTLAVVASTDPIAELGVERRLITFG